VEKYCRAGQVTDDNNMAHADFMPDNLATNTRSDYVILKDFPLKY
jgi:hypothetical protein